MRRPPVLRVVVAALALVACGEADDAGPTGEPHDSFIEGRFCEPDDSATWESFGQGFLLDHCTGCHSGNLAESERAGAPLGVDFETRELAQQWLERIYARAADDNVTMPPVDSVPAHERELLGDWLACGAP